LLPLGALLLSSCKASVKGEVNTSGEGEVADFDKPLDEAAATRNQESAFADPSAENEGFALLGARHDLRLVAGDRETTCECLKVALGRVNAPGVQWEATPPKVDPQTQLVLALSSDGVSCANAPKQSRGASYWGYKTSGNDVIVVVEASLPGRPLTQGAIIPKPYDDGEVYVEPLAKDLPYGRPLGGGDKLCKLGNPGPRRSSNATQSNLDSP
jgi:hypothetical protein